MLDKHHLHGDRVLLIMKFNAYESMICIKQGIFKQKIHQNKAWFWCGFFSLSFYLSSSSSSFCKIWSHSLAETTVSQAGLELNV